MVEYEFGVAQIETSSGIIFKDLFCHYLLICREQVQNLIRRRKSYHEQHAGRI